VPNDDTHEATEPQPPVSTRATEPELPPLDIPRDRHSYTSGTKRDTCLRCGKNRAAKVHEEPMPQDEWVDALAAFYREAAKVRGGDIHQLIRDTWSVFINGADDEILDGYPPLLVTCVRLDIEKALR
jgi:hypothetical protein